MTDLEKCVKGIIARTPRAREDGMMLVGLVYERVLGERKAGKIGIKYCTDHCTKMGLPTPSEVMVACRRVSGAWEES